MHHLLFIAIWPHQLLLLSNYSPILLVTTILISILTLLWMIVIPCSIMRIVCWCILLTVELLMLVVGIVVGIVDRLVVDLIVVLDVVIDTAGVQHGVTEKKHVVLADVLVSIILRRLEQISFADAAKQSAIVTRRILARVIIITYALYFTIIVITVVWIISKARLDRFELSQFWMLFNWFISCGNTLILTMLLWSDTTMVKHFILIFVKVFFGDARVGELLGESLHPRIVRVDFLSRAVRLRSSKWIL